MNSFDQISQAAMQLPDADRLALAESLMQSVTGAAICPEIRDDWLAEIRRRREAYLRGETTSFSVDQTLRSAHEKLDDMTGASPVKLRIVAAAHDEVIGSAAYYEAQQTGLGRDFLQEVQTAFVAIEEHPERYAQLETTDLPIRRVLLKRFPYYVAYEVLEAEVIVWAVAHGAREPGYWQTRRS